MKIYLCIIGIFSALVLVECGPHSELLSLLGECRKEAELPFGTFIKGSLNFDDPKVNGFCACVMKRGGIMVEGKVVAEKAMEFAARMFPGGGSDSVKADIQECASKANEEKDERNVVAALGNCIVTKRPFPK